MQPMRILILGGAGMLGHKLVQRLRDDFDVWSTVRGRTDLLESYGLLDRGRVLRVDVLDFDSVIRAFAIVKPEAVINCIGIIKQLPTAADPRLNLTVNALLPHRLQQLCRVSGARLVHFSTDCVFSGRKGSYTEEDTSDAEDLYGRTKFLGETSGAGVVTIRSSLIGRELRSASGLVEWFLSQRGRQVRGFTRAIYSGFTTQAMARVIQLILTHHRDLCGTVQISSSPISKYDLLHLLNGAFAAGADIVPDDSVRVDRSLDSTRFRQSTGFEPPSWPRMIEDMAEDPTPYDEWRQTRAPTAQD
jgi:dTDP-4-dehydrorhamnose reductase